MVAEWLGRVLSRSTSKVKVEFKLTSSTRVMVELAFQGVCSVELSWPASGSETKGSGLQWPASSEPDRRMEVRSSVRVAERRRRLGLGYLLLMMTLSRTWWNLHLSIRVVMHSTSARTHKVQGRSMLH